MHNTLKNAIFGCSLILAPAHAFEVQPRIVGGCESSTGAYPWMVAVATKLTISNDVIYEWVNAFCGATLIDERWVVTAAHCLFDSSNGNTAYSTNDLEVYIGTTRLDSGQGAHYAISEIHTHPSYNSPTPLSNDIALLKLAETATATPARLATIKPNNNLQAITAGWGKIADSTVTQENATILLPRDLREVNVGILDNSLCPFNLANSQICAGFLAGGRDSCQGDSGGPLMLRSQNQDTLVGIVSYGNGCAKPNSPGVYTSVAAYRDWIAEITLNTTTGVSDLPAPTVVSENYAHFSACGTDTTTPTTPTPTPTTTIVTSGGGAASHLLLLLSMFSLGRYRLQTRPTPKAKRHR